MPRLTRCFSQCDARFSECAQRSPLRSAALAEWDALQRAMRALAAAHDHETVQTILADLSQDLSHERAGVLAAVRMHGSALAQAAEYLKRDREIVLAAVRADGGALAHAAPELKGDREIVLAAVGADGGALAHAAPELQQDREVLLVWKDAAWRREFKRDREIVLAAVRADGGTLAHAAPEVQEDREVLLVSKHAGGAGKRRVRVEAEPGTRSLGRAQGAPGRKVLEDVLRRRERPPRLER